MPEDVAKLCPNYMYRVMTIPDQELESKTESCLSGLVRFRGSTSDGRLVFEL